MHNISVYLNQRASQVVKNGSDHFKNEISNALFRSQVEFLSPANLEELYQRLDLDVKNNVDAILSVGGDGTVNTIIQRLAGTDIGLLVVPGGTANDLARVLGTSFNIKRITQTIRQNNKKKIDLVSINGKFMATNGGLGFASEVALEINELRANYPQFKNFMKISGKNIYSLFLAKKLLNRDIPCYKFKVQSKEYSGTFLSPLILVNNQPEFGGDFPVAPFTNNQDGKVNITIFKHPHRLELISCMLKILNNNYPTNDKHLISFETNEANINLLDDEKISFFGDGENFHHSASWNILCHKNLLSVYAPKDQKEMVNLCTQVSLI